MLIGTSRENDRTREKPLRQARYSILATEKGIEFHEVSEWEVDILLEGELSGAYLRGDNSSVVPTDTLKNAVLALAYDLENVSRDGFARALGGHFLSQYQHLTACDVEVREKLWTRLAPEGKPHPHSFVREPMGTPFSKGGMSSESLCNARREFVTYL